MGWYLRKSLSFGPLRINLSKSGLGGSVGVKGLRVGTGPNGPYVQGGREGFYFRESLSPGASRKTPEGASLDDSAVGVPEQRSDQKQAQAAAPGPGDRQFGMRLLRAMFGAILRRR